MLFIFLSVEDNPPSFLTLNNSIIKLRVFFDKTFILKKIEEQKEKKKSSSKKKIIRKLTLSVVPVSRFVVA